jgi:hypothetical protein
LLAIGGAENAEDAGLDECEGPVFHLAGGAFLGRDVGDLFEFEGGFQRDGGVGVAAEEEDQRHILPAGRELFDGVLAGERFLREVGPGPKFLDRFVHADARHFALLGDPEAKQHEDETLRGVRLGAGDADLGAGLGVDHAVAFAGDGRAHDVHDA